MPGKKPLPRKRVKRGRTMPAFTKAPPEVLATFEAALAGVENFDARTMFGYPAAFAHGNMFACVFQDRVMVRLSSADREAALALEGAKLFAPVPGRPMREYVDLPMSVQRQATALGDWLARGRAYAATLPKKQRKKQAKKSVAKGAAKAKKARSR